MLNASVGLSTERTENVAAKEALKEALGGMNGKPKLCILAVDHTARKRYNYNEIIEVVYNELGEDVLIIGSSVSGIMVNNRLALKSVGMLLLEGDINIDAKFMFEKSRLNYGNIADDILKYKETVPKRDNQFMLLFQDGIKLPKETLQRTRSLNSRMVALMSGFIGKQFQKQFEQFAEQGLGFPSTQELLEKLFKNGWEIPIIGNVTTNATDYKSYEFYKNKVLEDSILGVIISGSNNTKFAFGFNHGAVSTGITCTPTKYIGNFLLKIDGEPALKGYCKAFNIEKDILYELENQGFVNYYHVLGAREPDGKSYHLTLTLTDPTMENLIVSGFPFNKIPDKIELFMSNSKMVLNSAVEAIRKLKEQINEPKFLFGIDCSLRWNCMGDLLDKYIEAIRTELGKDVPLFMIGSGGEIFGTKNNDYYSNHMTFVPLIGGN